MQFRQATAIAAIFALGLGGAASAADQVPFTMLVAQTPWFPAFEELVSVYEDETGNQVNLDVNPSPVLMDKVRGSVKSGEGEFDLLAMNALTLPEYYYGGYVSELTAIDPDFKIEDGVISYGGSELWDPSTRKMGQGKAYGVPINGNIQLLYYRKDLYEGAGLSVPKTWDELYANAQALTKEGVTGMVVRGNRSFADSSYNFFPYLISSGGSLYEENADGGYTVTINSPDSLLGLDTWTKLADPSVSAADPATIGQAKMIELLATGKAAQAVMVAAAWPQLDDPNKSLVVGKMAVAPLPAGPAGAVTTLGHWLAGVSANVPDDRKQAALAFLDWFQTAEAQQAYVEFGGIPVRTDAYEANMSDEGPNRWMGAMAASADIGVPMFTIPEGVDIVPQVELRLQQALLGEMTNAQALNALADDIAGILEKAGYAVTRLDPLN